MQVDVPNGLIYHSCKDIVLICCLVLQYLHSFVIIVYFVWFRLLACLSLISGVRYITMVTSHNVTVFRKKLSTGFKKMVDVLFFHKFLDFLVAWSIA